MEWGEYFYYDETSPSCLRWKVLRGMKIHIGDPAGHLKKNGYFYVGLLGKNYRAHRVVYELMSGKKITRGLTINHKDTNRQNNKFENLEEATHARQGRCKRRQANNTSGICGVSRESIKNNRYHWKAFWCDLQGVLKTKSFSVSKYGEDGAFKLACEYRAKMIDELNALGAGYSEIHGT